MRGITVLALGKLGSRELNYSSDVDLLLLFDPETMPRRERDDPSEAAVRVGRRMIELLQKRTEDGYVVRVDLRLRPSPEVTPIVLAGQRGDFALRILRAPLGARGLHPRPRLRRRPRARRAFPRVDPAVRLAPLARLRGDRGSPRNLRAHPRPFRARCEARPGLRPEARARAESARSSSSPRSSR